MPFGDLGDDLIGQKSQVLMILVTAADFCQVMSQHRRYRCTIRIIRGFIDDVV